jgi:hypothetical protein
MRIQILPCKTGVTVKVDGKKVSHHKTMKSALKKVYLIKTGGKK